MDPIYNNNNNNNSIFAKKLSNVNGGWGVPGGENKWLLGIGGVAFGDKCKISQAPFTTHYHFNIHNNTCWLFPALDKRCSRDIIAGSLSTVVPTRLWR